MKSATPPMESDGHGGSEVHWPLGPNLWFFLFFFWLSAAVKGRESERALCGRAFNCHGVMSSSRFPTPSGLDPITNVT